MSFLNRLKWIFTGKGMEPPVQIATENNSGDADFRAPQPPNTEIQELSEEEFVKRLMAHPIFTEVREWSEYRTKVLAIDDPIKKKMAKYYLALLFNSIYGAIKQTVTEHDKYLSDTITLNNLLIDTIAEVHKNAAAYGVPEIFLDKITHYLYSQTKILNSTYKDLDKFEYYSTEITRATFRLDLEFLTLRNITFEIESVINEMNGNLRAALEGSVFDN